MLTSNNAKRFGINSLEWTRGESAFILDFKHVTFPKISHVEEGLGTKNLVADAMMKITGKSYYDQIAQDTVAMIVNDMITLGSFPISLAMHLAVWHSDWFKNQQRVNDLVSGWGDACDQAGCVWAGGETPTLRDIIYPEASLLSGSAVGINLPMGNFNPSNIKEGDSIIIFESSGIHANCLTLSRELADKLPNGYETLLSDGRMYGEALLDPTHIYCNFLELCVTGGTDIHYAVNITGHGWRKFMRAPQPFSYVIEKLPTQLPIFDFIQEHGPVSDKEAYSNLNMGAGFAIFVPGSSVDDILLQCNEKFRVFVAGYVEESSVKRVVIKPKGLEYKAETLAVR
ncbi:MAG TPA: AIR synthase related protein [Candidatus Paceibacterota bacterium]|nr:AIR synthase related protein [Candidatus Paceibacterota bacterium]HPT17819.1 AIR synthase related protein [Candidatus Paceibacterota bacterium]